jgi:hypothetical protein
MSWADAAAETIVEAVMARVKMRAVEVVSVRFGAMAIFLTKIRGDFSPFNGSI